MGLINLIGIILVTATIFFSIIRYIKLNNKNKILEAELLKLRNAHEEFVENSVQESYSNLLIENQDSITGLANRKVFEDRVNQAILHGKRQKILFGIVSLEIENFQELKVIHQSYLDALLKEFANRVVMSIRQIDTLSRFADGHFLLYLPHLSRPETAIYVAQRIQDNLMQPIIVENTQINLSAYMGIAVYPVDGENQETLLRNSEKALKQACTNKVSRYQFYQPDIHLLGQRELDVSQLIRGEDFISRLHIQYKPFFNILINKPFYLQAVPQLRHPKHGMIPFHKFSNIAENSGKMLEINEWLLTTTINTVNQWPDNQFVIDHLAVPISLRQLENPHFLVKFNEILKIHNKKNIKIVLEIIDDNWTQNVNFIEKLFLNLNDSDVKITVSVLALTHFAMQKARQIPIHFLKLDSKIIKELASSESKNEIIKNMIELAKSENITVMAEGVDNNRVKAQLRLIGCEVMEGKIFGCLMPTGTIIGAG